MRKLKYLNWLVFATLFVFHSCANNDERFRKEIIGSYSYAITDDSDEDVFVTINGTCVFKSNGVYENNGTMVMSVIDDKGRLLCSYHLSIKGAFLK